MIDAVARARALVGVPFRFQGRDAATGLDCVGLVIEAFDLGRHAVAANYDWRIGRARAHEVARPFFEERDDLLQAADVLLVRTGRGRRHLAIWTGSGAVHADAVAGRVVERPGGVPWPVEAVWRLKEISERTASWRP